MVCRGQDGEWGGAVFEVGDGEEGEEWGSVELGSTESVIWGWRRGIGGGGEGREGKGGK